ncbi:hypothetical protein ACFLV7_00875 [Chloroflexota bacterium]
MRKLLLVGLVLLLAALACNGGDGNGDSVKEVEIEAEVVEKIESAQKDIQEAVEQLETELPEQTAWLVFVDCQECEGLPLSLWENVDDMGNSPGKVNHGEMCVVLEVGSFEGVERYRIDCAGVVGWLRAEGLVTP